MSKETTYTAIFTRFSIKLTGPEAQALQYGTSTDIEETSRAVQKRLLESLSMASIQYELWKMGISAHSRTQVWRAISILAAEQIVENYPELMI